MLWKMSIRTGGPKGIEAFDWCKGQGIIGIGWSCAYAETTCPLDPIALLSERYPDAASPARMVLNGLKRDHLVWLQRRGHFFLCKVRDDEALIGPGIGPDFATYDVGHARRAAWVQVPEDLVPGKVQRAVIAPRMICRIPSQQGLVNYCTILHDGLSTDSEWRPALDKQAIRTALDTSSQAEMVELASPDDWEDVIAAYLQTAGWILVKSSCFRSKPEFEFRMIREEAGRTKTAYLQVKSGQEKLPPNHYQKYVSTDTAVFLFSNHPIDPYPSPAVPNVFPLLFETLRSWMRENVSLLPFSLRARLCLVSSRAHPVGTSKCDLLSK